ncbi:hypothetical protein F5J12DRAFT_954221 [Pisolithus orientalis]|uniref:uncharacterized protein n=1 Tax=Pisolithus orientalis TaxID=936130 RepID=UPI0022251D13|nr:uncharacterized protein F5J12DRAFT_954221 [Pisolithus orientalis]KAI6030649.1 hypothetical protein F5J12DRAFT_954221 [Pisolithus orientalis]
MSVNHAAHMPQSLPPFAEAFSSSSLSSSNALPPIQSQSYERTRQATHSPANDSCNPTVELIRTARKRSREEGSLATLTEANSDRCSPRGLRIKEEDERDAPSESPHSPTVNEDVSHDPSPTPSTQPSPKKRRVTVSGPTQPLDSTTRPALDQPASTPISPVIISLTNVDEPNGRERSLLTVKPQHRSLLEQRRESITGVTQASFPSGSSSKSPPEDHLSASKLSNVPRIGRRSPNEAAGTSRSTGGGAQAINSSQVFSPPPMIVPSQQPLSLNSPQVSAESSSIARQSPIAHSLPPPSISFTTRRTAQSGGRKKKPADILISPRGTGPSDPLLPVVQSAPPVADRFPMAIPRLPSAINNATQTTRRTVSNVPPTPTRFALRDAASSSVNSTGRTGTTSLSPPNVSVPIASSLAPHTPNALHHPGYSVDKSAFLAPFETFYDALNGSKQLKGWLADQLQKSSALMQSLKQQQEKMDTMVEDLVEKRTRALREEIAALRQRVESLEEAVQTTRGEGSTRGPQTNGGSGYLHNMAALQNSSPPGSEPSTTYRFPAPDQRRSDFTRAVLSPERPQDKEPQRSPPLIIEASRRISISGGTRPDPARMINVEGGQLQGSHPSFGPSGHHSRGGPPGSSKGTPPLRPQTLPERSINVRQTDPAPRSSSRLVYPPPAKPDARRKSNAALEER